MSNQDGDLIRMELSKATVILYAVFFMGSSIIAGIFGFQPSGSWKWGILMAVCFFLFGFIFVSATFWPARKKNVTIDVASRSITFEGYRDSQGSVGNRQISFVDLVWVRHRSVGRFGRELEFFTSRGLLTVDWFMTGIDNAVEALRGAGVPFKD